MRNLFWGCCIALPALAQEGALPPALQHRQLMPSPFQTEVAKKPAVLAPVIRTPRRVWMTPEKACTPPMPAMQRADASVAMPELPVTAEMDAGMVVPARVCKP